MRSLSKVEKRKKNYLFFFFAAFFFFFGAAFLVFFATFLTFLAAFFFFIMEEKVKMYEVHREPIYDRMLTKKVFNVKFIVCFMHDLSGEIFFPSC